MFYILVVFLLWKYQSLFMNIARSYSIKHLESIKIIWDKQLSQLIMTSSLSGESIQLPKFKFYHLLSIEIIDYAKKWGFPYKENLIQLRSQAQKDFLFSLKNLKFFWQSISQFIVILLITWIFRYAMVSVVKMSFWGKSLNMIMALQLSGFFFFIGADIIVKKNKLKVYEAYFYSLYLFQGLISLNMPFQMICERAKLLEMVQLEDRLVSIREAVKALTHSILNHGGEGVGERIGLICEELRYKQEQDFDETHKIMNVFKLVAILFFFFPAYLLNIHEILNTIPF